MVSMKPPTEHKFGYELASKQVRVYQTHDIGSVRRAITANLQEYLVYEGVLEEDPTSLKSLFLKVITVGVAAAIYGMSKSQVSGWPLTSSFLVFGALIVFQYTCSLLQRSEDIIFLGTGQQIADQSRVQKPCFRRLKDQRLCIRLSLENLSVPVVKFEAQLVGPPRLFSPPSVYSRVEKTVQYGQFFGSTGFFYPPQLLKLVDGMLEGLSSKKKK